MRPAERAYTLSTRQGWEEFVTAPSRQRPDPLTRAQLRELPEPARAEYEERRSVWHANIGPLRTPQMRASTSNSTTSPKPTGKTGTR